MSAQDQIIRVLMMIASVLRKCHPAVILGATLGGAALFFVGCEGLFDTQRWTSTHRPEAPPEVIVDRQVRVRLLELKPGQSAEMAVTSSFSAVDAVAGRQLAPEHPPLSLATLRPATSGGIALGGETFDTTNLLITPARDASIVLNQQTYRGALRILRAGEALTVINLVDVEAYLRGVLRGELPRYFHPESFKAQCVAARTYVLYQKRIAPPGRPWDVVDDEGSQMYIGVKGEDAIAISAVDGTRGEVCLWNDGTKEDIFCTYYSSACGGRSQHVNNVKPRDPDVGPLRGGVVCEDCYVAPNYKWGPVEISRADMTKKLVARYPVLKKLGLITDLRPKARTPDGRILHMELIGSGGAKDTLVGEDFRLTMGGRLLKSTNFKISKKGDRFVFSDGKGFGHGMGLCQYGTETKARRGMDHKAILAAYYPGAIIKTIY